MNLRNKTLLMILRTLGGLMLVVFGLNGFLNFMPMDASAMPEGAMAFMSAMMASGYLMYTVKGLEIVIGLMLIFNKFTPLATVLLAPLSINFMLFHIFLLPAGTGMAVFIFLVNIYLAYIHWDKYAPMLKA